MHAAPNDQCSQSVYESVINSVHFVGRVTVSKTLLQIIVARKLRNEKLKKFIHSIPARYHVRGVG